MTGALDRHLKRQGLLPSTRDKYREILESSDKRDIVSWINSKVHARTPIGTVLPMRAAVKHYLVGELGYSEEDVQSLLPKARGRAARSRHALTPDQLALYHAAVEEVSREPARTILALLPCTGLRIGEATSLHVSNLRRFDGRYALLFRGKRDKERVVPLSRAGEAILLSYLDEHEPEGWLFPSFTGRPITPHSVRKYTRKIAVDCPALEGLSPHILRHTFATMALRRGVDLERLRVLLGHENIQTTSRYLHPSVSDLQSAMDRFDK